MSVARHLEQCYDAHAQALFGYLLNLTGNEADTRDVLQELFHRLAARPQLLDAARHPRRFLLRMAHNLAVDQVRRRLTREQTLTLLTFDEATDRFTAAADPDTATFRRELGMALESLPFEQRAVVHLKLWEGFTFEAIAELLNLPLNTAASRYRYGLDKLRERLRPLYREIQ